VNSNGALFGPSERRLSRQNRYSRAVGLDHGIVQARLRDVFSDRIKARLAAEGRLLPPADPNADLARERLEATG
jgi:hypothetical protein